MIGIAAFAALIYTALASLSGLIIPLVIAVVIGTLAVPLVDALDRRRVPRVAAAIIVMLGIGAAIVASVSLAIAGIIDQGAEISRFLTAGLASVDEWLEGAEFDIGVADDRIDQAKEFGYDLIPGFASWFSGLFSSAVSFLAGTFLAVFLLYFVLVDWDRLRDWLGRHVGADPELGAGAVEDGISTLREGFAALTISSLVTAVLIGGTMWALGLPLAFSVALVTFVTSYIPYIGAIFSALFACLVALGSGEPSQALILLIVILIVQNVVQTVLGTKLTSDRLRLHPIASLVSTIVGASLAGLLGATLSAPVLATVIRINQRVKDRAAMIDVSDG